MSARPAPSATPGDAAVLAQHAAFIDDMLDAYYEWAEGHHWQPVEGSPWANEGFYIHRQFGPGGDWNGPWLTDNLMRVPSTLLTLSGQYLEAIRTLLEAHQIVSSLPPLVRSALEVNCRVTWLLAWLKGPDLGNYQTPARPRVARAMLMHLDDVKNAREGFRGLGDAGWKHWRKAQRQARDDLIPRWFYESEVVRDENDILVSLCGETLPGLRAGAVLYERLWEQDWKAGGVYDFLSNGSHPNPHVVSYLTRPTESGKAQLAIKDITYVSRLVRVAVVTFLQAWQITAVYLGFPYERVHDLLDRVPE